VVKNIIFEFVSEFDKSTTELMSFLLFSSAFIQTWFKFAEK